MRKRRECRRGDQRHSRQKRRRVQVGTASAFRGPHVQAPRLAAVGTACAACHQMMGGPRKGIALSAPAGEEEPTMLSHQAAVDELWDGLVTPDAAAWQRAARSLSSEALAGAD